MESLWYPRLYRPLAVIVENVDKKEAKSAIESAYTLSLEGYRCKTFAEKRARKGGMRHRRRYWVGKKGPAATGQFYRIAR